MNETVPQNEVASSPFPHPAPLPYPGHSGVGKPNRMERWADYDIPTFIRRGIRPEWRNPARERRT
jgi:hypothetical protein